MQSSVDLRIVKVVINSVKIKPYFNYATVVLFVPGGTSSPRLIKSLGSVAEHRPRDHKEP